MFNFINSVKKLAGLSKKDNKQPQSTPEESKKALSAKIDKISGLLNDLTGQVVNEYKTIREKSKNLSETNLKLGMKYLEEGNLSEAIFRFKITKKFWPDNYEAQYQLIICLVLDEQFEEAEKLMNELSAKSPEYKTKIEQNFGAREQSSEEVRQENGLSENT